MAILDIIALEALAAIILVHRVPHPLDHPTPHPHLPQALADHNARPSPGWLGALMSCMQTRMQQLPGSSLVLLLWGLVRLGVRPTSVWLATFVGAEGLSNPSSGFMHSMNWGTSAHGVESKTHPLPSLCCAEGQQPGLHRTMEPMALTADYHLHL